MGAQRPRFPHHLIVTFSSTPFRYDREILKNFRKKDLVLSHAFQTRSRSFSFIFPILTLIIWPSPPTRPIFSSASPHPFLSWQLTILLGLSIQSSCTRSATFVLGTSCVKHECPKRNFGAARSNSIYKNL